MSQHLASILRQDADPLSTPLALDAICERCMGNQTVITILLDKFEAQLVSDDQRMEESFAKKDFGELGRIAHALKGAAGAMAASNLHDRAAMIENLARQDFPNVAAHDLALLRGEIERCLHYLPEARIAIRCRTILAQTPRE